MRLLLILALGVFLGVVIAFQLVYRKEPPQPWDEPEDDVLPFDPYVVQTWKQS